MATASVGEQAEVDLRRFSAFNALRRVLGDDTRERRFIRTVSRQGYQFIFDVVVEESDEGTVGAPSASRIDMSGHAR